MTRARRVVNTPVDATANARAARAGLRVALFGGEPVPNWRERAACATVPTAFFFPEDEGTHRANAAIRRAKRVCAGCPVREHCLADVMAYESTSYRYGVVGGTSAAERSRRSRRGVEQAGASVALHSVESGAQPPR
jgi:WhiB family transcriptional regulator, redox-sensing transcriptional regulator